jgi:N-acetylglucosamine-6-phosphate deacetylase
MRVTFPGFVDLQVNGFAGIDFNSETVTPDRVREACAAIRSTGVTRFLPTIITSSFERFAACARVLVAVDDHAIAGIHMEGPYISPADGPRGAHPREHTRAASIDDFKRRQDAAAGRIVLVTIAPEVPGAIALIEHLADAGVRVAIGHSEATPPIVQEAIRAGASLSTHLGNGCAAVLPRHPNLIWEQLAADDLTATFIVDGHHLPPATVKAAMRAKSPARTILVSDAMAAAACPSGSYRIGDVDVEVGSDRRVSLRGTPYLAGSALTMPEAVANTVRFTGLPLDEVLPMATTIPARAMGMTTAGRVTAEWDAGTFALDVEMSAELRLEAR